MRDALTRTDAHKQEALIRSLVQRGVVDRVDASKKMQTLDISLRNGHKPTKVEHWERYGMTYNPHEGAEVLAVAIGGNQDHLAVIDVADRRHRPRDLKSGELVVHDDQGQSVHFTRDGLVVTSPKGVTIECAAGITLKGPLTIEGDITHTGNNTQTGLHVDSSGPHTA